MKIHLSAILDKEFRDQVRNTVLEVAKSISREETNATLKAEAERILSAVVVSSYRLNDLVKEAIVSLLQNHWTEVGQLIQAETRKAVDDRLGSSSAIGSALKPLINRQLEKAVAQKLRDKTVWEAKEQDAYVRKVAREVFREALKP